MEACPVPHSMVNGMRPDLPVLTGGWTDKRSTAGCPG
jgi:hypothetical protein